MLGQPPTSDSATGIANTHSDDWSSDDLGLNKILRGMYRREGTSAFAVDPRDFILKERLDDRESYLMDGMSSPIASVQTNGLMHSAGVASTNRASIVSPVHAEDFASFTLPEGFYRQ